MINKTNRGPEITNKRDTNTSLKITITVFFIKLAIYDYLCRTPNRGSSFFLWDWCSSLILFLNISSHYV